MNYSTKGYAYISKGFYPDEGRYKGTLHFVEKKELATVEKMYGDFLKVDNIPFVGGNACRKNSSTACGEQMIIYVDIEQYEETRKLYLDFEDGGIEGSNKYPEIVDVVRKIVENVHK